MRLHPALRTYALCDRADLRKLDPAIAPVTTGLGVLGMPGVTQWALSADEMAEYRRPFLKAGDDRWPTLQWPREVPLSGEPADVHDRIAAYSAWLKTASLPKLFIDAEPGVFITGRIRRLASSFPNQHRVVVGGLHFVQEDSPDEIGRAIAGWLERI
jgi:haloalkane dehalogenase